MQSVAGFRTSAGGITKRHHRLARRALRAHRCGRRRALPAGSELCGQCLPVPRRCGCDARSGRVHNRFPAWPLLRSGRCGQPCPGLHQRRIHPARCISRMAHTGNAFLGRQLLIAVALLHMTFVFWNGGYRPPRELNWMVGVLIFLIVVLFSFTGSLLPWDANSYLARAREISIISGSGVLPDGVSAFIRYAVQGGPLVGPTTLLRFFMAHVFLLPGLMAVLLYVHFRLVRKQGPAEPA